MEARKDTLNSIKLCRFCLSQDEPLQSLYNRKEPKNTVPLPLKILSSVSVEVFPSDKMPSYICKRCRFFMDLCYEYKSICRQADETTLQYIQSGTALEPVVWAPSLTKAFRSGARGTSNIGVVKTVVEGGATVEVTSQEVSDSDDGDENVYNVKIEGSDEGSAFVKVVTSNDNEGKPSKKGKGANKVIISSGADSDDFEIITPSRGHDEEISSGCWACSECDSTFPLQQLLELHKMQKHRTRTVSCDECNAKFFSKYDLMTHQLRHSDETPFQCVACNKKFKRLVLLKRHEKLMHSELPQLSCPNCPATFLSIEELETHQKKHTAIRRYTCGLCDKKYCDNQTLHRHITSAHSTKPDFCCEYCPAQFTTISKLMRHVRTHAGDRAYPCKYCDKSFGKSHHYTRHLRVKHREMIGDNVQVPGNAVRYSCEQCDDTFNSQDDLIYHSAIHATQNLTCPLCQEKFKNVDDVTAHIKSHVNGTEFMCDFCELVFTCREKLDYHMVFAHEDEIAHLPEFAQNESSLDMDAEEFEYDNTMNLKEEDDHMVVEIKKPDNFMFTNSQEMEKVETTNSEESEAETTTYMELATVDTLAMLTRAAPPKPQPETTPTKPIVAPVTVSPQAVIKTEKNDASITASILRKAEEVKRKVVQQQPSDTSVPEKKPPAKVESSSSGGASDKSLRLLEKELQELKRTTTRNNDAAKIPAKTSESIRTNRRTQMHTSTPKLRSAEEKRSQASPRTPAIEKKIPEKRAVKENKEPKETKEVKPANIVNKEDKDAKVNAKETTVKEDKEKEPKENETPKLQKAVKNGTTEKSNAEEGVRRSTRPSKVKDYAKMIRDSSKMESDDDDSDDDDEEYVEAEKSTDSRVKTKRGNPPKAPPKNVKATPAATPTSNPRKRGRPRKPVSEVPAKVKKDEDTEEENKPEKEAEENDNTKETTIPPPEEAEKEEKEETESKDNSDENSNTNLSKTPTPEQTPAGVLVSPTGQTLKKVPIKALPPGVKPLPLPVSARPMGPRELCEMQIGKRTVKVQKIVMTKAEVEAMTKKGLVEMKDGTMVLKQGIKIPTSDPVTLKSTLVGEETGKESPSKKDKAVPTRCELGEES